MTKSNTNTLLFLSSSQAFFHVGYANKINGILIPHLRKALQLKN
jgi:fucose permease